MIIYRVFSDSSWWIRQSEVAEEDVWGARLTNFREARTTWIVKMYLKVTYEPLYGQNPLPRRNLWWRESM